MLVQLGLPTLLHFKYAYLSVYLSTTTFTTASTVSLQNNPQSPSVAYKHVETKPDYFQSRFPSKLYT